MIFLPPLVFSTDYDYPLSVYSDLRPLIKDSDLIGFSFVSNYVGQARRVTRFIKKEFDMPVVWGGIHAMADPEKSLEYADMVCMGEGEEALSSLLNTMQSGADITKSKNFYFRRNGDIIKNELIPLVANLDKYPYPLYDTNREYIVENGKIVPMSLDIIKRLFVTSREYFRLKNEKNYYYLTLTSRGCLNACTYCCNNLFLQLYKDRKNIIRRRSVNNVIGELLYIREKFPFVNFFAIFDDDFCAVDTEYIQEFSIAYKKYINLPFKCNISPVSLNEDKIMALRDAGLVSVEMGLQSASEETNRKIYKRNVNKEKFMKSASMLNKYKEILPYYDIILDNPFEPARDVIKTIRFLMQLPKPYEISSFSLTFFPGTELYRTAKSKKIILDEDKEVCNKKNNALYRENDPYLKFLLELSVHLDGKNGAHMLLFNALSCRPAIFIFRRGYFLTIYKSIRWLRSFIRDIKKNKHDS